MLKKRLNNKKGFTLAELLIAVAIIGILVAVSVPIFTSKLSEAKVATDEANIRAAKVAATAKYLETDFSSSVTYYYNAETGKLETSKPQAYSQEESGNVLSVQISDDGTVEVEWVAASGS